MKGTWISKKKKENENSHVIALAGNPNVGKSTVFNALTGLRQHTGNWPGKTVGNAIGYYSYLDEEYCIYDLPGTYSLLAHSEEEEVARDFICFGSHELVVVVCDAVSLERNLNLVLQTLEITDRVVVCINLLDEAKKKKIEIDLEKLSQLLGVPVVGTSARSGSGLEELVSTLKNSLGETNPSFQMNYGKEIEYAISIVEKELTKSFPQVCHSRFLALQLIDDNESIHTSINRMYPELYLDEKIEKSIQKARGYLMVKGIDLLTLKDQIVGSFVQTSEDIAKEVVIFKKKDYSLKDRKIDRILTSKRFGIPIMLCLLMVVFWITIEGANIPSDFLFQMFSQLGNHLLSFCHFLHFPNWLCEMLVSGIYRTLTWVVSVMLPPMAIFFPFFTLLEDLGYLPRIAFNLDKYFKKCCACGKQALTMCMGFGCNAVGVTGARIIDSPRERLIAILTNVFVPCNGRFPTILAIITMFFVGFQGDIKASLLSAFFLTLVILIGIGLTFFMSWVLSKTLLKGVPSSFTLELPPYRRPQFLSVLIRSILDRTLFVLGRAVVVAAPAGLLIWLLANIKIGNVSLLLGISNFLDPFGKLIGLDGIILMAFLLGFPANEIVVPIMIMAYMATGSICEFSNLSTLKTLLTSHGWTYITAICTILFCLVHFPCSTTCLTIKKETGSWKWTILGVLIPTVCGILLCFIVANLLRFLSIFI